MQNKYKFGGKLALGKAKERELTRYKLIGDSFSIAKEEEAVDDLMWSHYGDYHKRFCIGFNEEKMRTCGLFGKGGSVTYSKEFPEINPMEQEHSMVTGFKQTHYKAEDWEYEKEYRLTNLFFPNPPTMEQRVIKDARWNKRVG
mgnify:CR=1 FL=1